MTLTADPTGTARSPGVSYQQLLDADSRPVPDVLRWEAPAYFGDEDKPIDRYISREVHELEKERLWTKVWQMACRESELANVGDSQVYDITDISILLVRTSPTEIKGYFNACLHRGRQLREGPGPLTEVRCPFHGYAWNLDGSLKQVPCQWDFPQVRPEEFHLPEVKVGTWGGFVFINMDPALRAPRVVPRRPAQALRPLAAREPLQAGPRGPHPAHQLEDGAGGLHGGVPRRRHAPAAPARHRRRQQPVRRVGELQPGHHAERHAQPAPALGADRAGDVRLHERSPARHGPATS